MKTMRGWLVCVGLSCMGLLVACGAPKAAEESTAADTTAEDVQAGSDSAVDAAAEDVADTADVATTDVWTAPQACVDGGWSARPFATGPYGMHRHETADDFTLPLMDGTDWNFKEHWLGCETYVFVPDTIPVSDLDQTSIWEKDLDKLIKASPRNTHYFFLSRQSAANAATALQGMQDRVDAQLAKLPEEDANFWHEHLHVVAKRVQELDAWPAQLMKGHGAIGFGIDRFQQIRGFGLLADVSRPIAGADPSKVWPYKANLAFSAYEAVMYNGEAARADARANEDALVVPLWKGEVIEQFAETDVTLTTADKLAGYDTLEIEVEMRCPDPEKPEPGNCGAWDYIAWLAVRGDDGKNIEIARFITSYHRETHWIVDATPFLVYLRKGGTQHLRWEWAPEWNKQPTSTFLNLRFINRHKGLQPKTVTKLWDGGGFNSHYDELHPDKAVDLGGQKPKKVELWALITGHGADSGTQCAEFCNHQHVFGLSGKSWKKEHKEAGTSNKCIPNMDKGMTPNQGGTWWFGRGGWCPGMQVDPYVVDLSDAVTNTAPSLSYKGQLYGKTPPDGGANIDGAVWLVTYE